jgi:Au+-exporting ATPase
MNAPMKPDLTAASLITLPIAGMSCASCVGRVEAQLKTVPGVDTVSVNLATERADIRTRGPIDRTALVKAVETAGYAVPSGLTELSIDGMTCASCVGNVERALKAVPGVTGAIVNLATERASVEGTADGAALIAAVAGAGYTARIIDRGADDADESAARKQAEQDELRRDLTLAAVLTVPVFALEMGAHLIPGAHELIANTIGMQWSWYHPVRADHAGAVRAGHPLLRQGPPRPLAPCAPT